jgi:2-keto-3-deoxy-6-phosphogluconate aldolase
MAQQHLMEDLHSLQKVVAVIHLEAADRAAILPVVAVDRGVQALLVKLSSHIHNDKISIPKTRKCVLVKNGI